MSNSVAETRGGAVSKPLWLGGGTDGGGYFETASLRVEAARYRYG